METQKIPVNQIFLRIKSTSINFMNDYQERNVDAMLSHCSSACNVEFIPLGEDGKGKAYFLGKAMWSSLIECFPNIDNTVHHVINEDGDAKCEVTIWGKQVKDFAGIVSKGNEFEQDHIFIFKQNEAGKIDSVSVNWDHESFVKQLTA